MPEAQPAPLPPDRLLRRCDLSGLDFATTADLDEVDLMAGQDRAADAIAFGAEVEAPGFNLFVIGAVPDSLDEAVIARLEERAKAAPAPPDWVYLNNFATPHRPIAMALPPGRGPAFRDAMHELVQDLKAALPKAFEAETFQARHAAIEQAFKQKQETAFKALQEEANAAGIAVIRTPFGFTLAPIKDGEVLRPDQFNELPEDERGRVREVIQGLEKKLETLLRAVPSWEKERRTELRALGRETAEGAVGHLIEEIRGDFTDLPKVLAHLDRVQKDLVGNVGLFAPQQDGGAAMEEEAATGPMERYAVNLLVSRPAEQGAPVVQELHPTLGNLVGRIEHLARQGTLVTDFRLIKPGALHRANGGYLLLDARAVLGEAFSWTALKRALRAGEIRIESAVDLLSLASTISLEPDPIPLRVKIVLFGERMLYYLLAAMDPELREHFKVLADFDDSLEREAGNEAVYARLVATIARQKNLLPLEREAVGRVLERAARLAGDAARLTLAMPEIGDLLVEAEFLAKREGAAAIRAADVQRAVAGQIHRASRIRDRVAEGILRDIALVDTVGTAVGQVNGLSVTTLGGVGFGRPARITARVSPGAGKVIDIEREVELGGPIHSKGVLILSGFLAGRYAMDAPISLLASLVFEQSYGGVDGDSASSAELYALLSALAEVPLRQDLAVTGSVNQHGRVQAIGGANEKIEGFFDICRARGLTGSQGVLIPAANVQHLMLRDDVVEACAAGRFAVYPIASIDEGLALLTGRTAGAADADGRFAEGSLNRLVADRLAAFGKARRTLAAPTGENGT